MFVVARVVRVVRVARYDLVYGPGHVGTLLKDRDILELEKMAGPGGCYTLAVGYRHVGRASVEKTTAEEVVGNDLPVVEGIAPGYTAVGSIAAGSTGFEDIAAVDTGVGCIVAVVRHRIEVDLVAAADTDTGLSWGHIVAVHDVGFGAESIDFGFEGLAEHKDYVHLRLKVGPARIPRLVSSLQDELITWCSFCEILNVLVFLLKITCDRFQRFKTHSGVASSCQTCGAKGKVITCTPWRRTNNLQIGQRNGGDMHRKI